MALSVSTADGEWVDDDAGPVVRHYARTQGRTRPAHGRFDLITVIVAARPATDVDPRLGPDHAAIVRICQNPMSVAELAARVDLPAGTVRVLLGDLLDHGFIRTRHPAPAAQFPTERVFRAVIDGLRSI